MRMEGRFFKKKMKGGLGGKGRDRGIRRLRGSGGPQAGRKESCPRQSSLFVLHAIDAARLSRELDQKEKTTRARSTGRTTLLTSALPPPRATPPHTAPTHPPCTHTPPPLIVQRVFARHFDVLLCLSEQFILLSVKPGCCDLLLVKDV